MKKVIPLIFLLLAGSLLAAPGYKTFYLGLEPKNKKRIIDDMLSDKGKSFWIKSGTILVKDNAQVLGKIETFLKSGDIAMPKQLRISLRRKGMTRQSRTRSEIEFELSKKRNRVGWKGGTRERMGNSASVEQITVINHKSAYISLKKSESTLLTFRNRFIADVLRDDIVDGVRLKVKPVISGKLVRLQLQSQYWARVKGKKRVFETGELSTVLLLRAGQWLDIGGHQSSSSGRQRRNLVLSRENSTDESVHDLSVMVEII